jgi:hypothetical protein
VTTPSQASVASLFAALKSHAQSLGVFRRVLLHEPKSAPGLGLSYAMWLGPVTPVAAASGQAASTIRLVMNGRIYAPFAEKPEDSIDVQLATAVFDLIAGISADFTLGTAVMEVDLLGAYGVALSSETVGYLEQDGRNYRVADLTIPLIIDAAAAQEVS